MTSKRVVSLLKKHRPTHIDDLDGVLSTHLLQGGCFRDAYYITGTRLVIKFPMGRYGKVHSRHEIRVIKALTHKSKFRHLSRYCPQLFYRDSKAGVLVMELLGSVGQVSTQVCEVVEKMFQDTLGSREGMDLKGYNIGRNMRGQIKILDFGLVQGRL